MPDEKCQKCGETSEDFRTLWMSCFYQMSEIGVPFQQRTYLVELLGQPEKEEPFNVQFYHLNVCKQCRASWLDGIKTWFNEPVKTKSCGSGIFIRLNGVNKEVTLEEFQEYRRNKETTK